MARLLIALGLLLVVVGALWAWLPRAFGWLGHLPGDVRIETRHGVVFIPVASMLVVSLVGTLLLNALAWLFKRLP